MSVQTISVRADDSDIRLDRWFKRHYPHLTHGQLEKLLRTGQVRVDGKRVKANQRLEPGQSVRVPPLSAAEKPAGEKPAPTLSRQDAEAIRAMVLYSDDAVIVLNKPPGLATQGGTGQTRHLDGMLDALRGKGEDRPRLVHRLDRDTSGVLLLARTAQAAKVLAAGFKHRTARKYYWALVAGVPQPRQGRIDLALAKRDDGRKEKVAAAEDDGKRAITLFTTLDAVGKRAAWLAMWPRTGRTHQLRVHAAAIGTPVLGDGKYGGAEAFLPGAEVADKLHLHARRIILPHPGGKGVIDVTAPMPPHMKESWSYFGFDEASVDADPFAEIADD